MTNTLEEKTSNLKAELMALIIDADKDMRQEHGVSLDTVQFDIIRTETFVGDKTSYNIIIKIRS